eukprot:9669513-Ditylum_brightwellii.AAC.1
MAHVRKEYYKKRHAKKRLQSCKPTGCYRQAMELYTSHADKDDSGRSGSTLNHNSPGSFLKLGEAIKETLDINNNQFKMLRFLDVGGGMEQASASYPK